MTLIESTPQVQKSFNTRTQDHGDAFNSNRIYDTYNAEEVRKRKDESSLESFNSSIEDAFDAETPDYDHMTPAQLAAEADKLLGETGMYTVGVSEAESREEVAEEPTPYQDRFPEEAEYGVKSRKEIARKLATVAQLDFNPDDDHGDDDFASPIRIKNRL